jgi:flagellin-like protein
MEVEHMKGISPLVASVLLIAFTVAIATIIMGWMGTFTRETTASISNKTTEAVDCASASINIDDVYISGVTVRAIVRNTGFANYLNLTNAVLYKTDGSFWTNTTTGALLNRGQVRLIEFYNTTTALTTATFSKVVVTTQCGGVSDTFDGTPKA